MADAPLRPVGLVGRRLVLDSVGALGAGLRVVGVRARLRELVSARLRTTAPVIGVDVLPRRARLLLAAARVDGGVVLALRRPRLLRPSSRGGLATGSIRAAPAPRGAPVGAGRTARRRSAAKRDADPRAGTRIADRRRRAPAVATTGVRAPAVTRRHCPGGQPCAASPTPASPARRARPPRPRYINRGDEIVRSRTERPTPPRARAPSDGRAATLRLRRSRRDSRSSFDRAPAPSRKWATARVSSRRVPIPRQRRTAAPSCPFQRAHAERNGRQSPVSRRRRAPSREARLAGLPAALRARDASPAPHRLRQRRRRACDSPRRRLANGRRRPPAACRTARRRRGRAAARRRRARRATRQCRAAADPAAAATAARRPADAAAVSKE